MNIVTFIKFLEQFDIDFFTGVPDSQLAPLCNYLMDNYGISNKHIIGANEGNCMAIASGYHLSTGKIPAVYLQNSGIGNIINPVASLSHPKVYGIPCVFVIGWRGEPGIKDEPQHIFQGEVTLPLLEIMDIMPIVIEKDTTYDDLIKKFEQYKSYLDSGKSIAFVVKKEAFTYDGKIKYRNNYTICREEAIRYIAKVAKTDIIVSTTGKISRELYEIRENNEESHKFDFLTVGSMGHSSSIALGISKNKKAKVWCIDGDGAALMHMGAMAVIGANAPSNLVHILINNEAHETVGGFPTVSRIINFAQIALGCGYSKAVVVTSYEELESVLMEAKTYQGLMLIEVKTRLGARENLGRPTTTANENKINFMEYLREVE